MNYAYSHRGFNSTPWSSWLAGMSPGMGQHTVAEYNRNPEMGYQAFIRMLNPSLADTDLMRKMYGNIQDQWNNENWLNFPKTGTYTNWADYLSNYDFEKEMARYGPAIRGDQSTRFFRPNTRVVTFQ